MTTSTLGRPLTLMFSNLVLLGGASGPPAAMSSLLTLIHHVAPHLTDVVVLQAHQLFAQRRFRSARALLEEAEAHNPKHTVLKAMLAAALYGQGDPMWEAYATEARNLPPDDEAECVLAAVDAAVQRARSPDRPATRTETVADTSTAIERADFMSFGLGLRC